MSECPHPSSLCLCVLPSGSVLELPLGGCSGIWETQQLGFDLPGEAAPDCPGGAELFLFFLLLLFAQHCLAVSWQVPGEPGSKFRDLEGQEGENREEWGLRKIRVLPPRCLLPASAPPHARKSAQPH